MNERTNSILYRILVAIVFLITACVIINVGRFWPRLCQWGPAALTLCYSGPQQAETIGSALKYDRSGDVLLIVDDERIAQAAKKHSFESSLWNYAWLNFLEQEVGGHYSVCAWDDLEQKHLLKRRLVIVTSSASSEIPSQKILDILHAFVQDGGCLILETPRSEWRGLSGGVMTQDTFNVSAGASQGKVLNYGNLPHSPGGQPRQGEKLLAQSPLFSFVHTTVLLEPDVISGGLIRDVPAFWQRRQGRGWIISLAFDFGMQLMAMQQGAPCENWKVREVTGLIPGMVESQDMALDRNMVDNDKPFADMFEDWFANYCEGSLKLWPRWWRFPYEYDGALAVTHDEENLGPDRFADLWKLEEKLQLRSTVFKICANQDDSNQWTDYASPYKANSEWEGATGSPVSWGVHWSRFWPYIPLRLQLQYACPGNDEPFSRIHYLFWGRKYAEPFRNLAAAGIVMDSSYGPNRGRGYLFGTGLPFQVLDKNGWPLGVWEWPFEAQENWSDVNSAYIESLLKASALNFHQGLVLLLHPHRWVSEAEGREYLEDIVTEARSRRHWLVNFNDYWQFLQARRRAVICSKMAGNKLHARIIAPEAGMALILSGHASHINIDGQPAQVRALRFNGAKHWLVAVPQGDSHLSAVYRE